jgi:hypothetical protein
MRDSHWLGADHLLMLNITRFFASSRPQLRLSSAASRNFSLVATVTTLSCGLAVQRRNPESISPWRDSETVNIVPSAVVVAASMSSGSPEVGHDYFAFLTLAKGLHLVHWAKQLPDHRSLTSVSVSSIHI